MEGSILAASEVLLGLLAAAKAALPLGGVGTWCTRDHQDDLGGTELPGADALCDLGSAQPSVSLSLGVLLLRRAEASPASEGIAKVDHPSPSAFVESRRPEEFPSAACSAHLASVVPTSRSNLRANRRRPPATRRAATPGTQAPRTGSSPRPPPARSSRPSHPASARFAMTDEVTRDA